MNSIDTLTALTEEAIAYHAECVGAFATALDRARLCGETLLELKQLVKFQGGSWLEFVAAKLPFGRTTAGDYMNVAANWDLCQGETSIAAALQAIADRKPQQQALQLGGDNLIELDYRNSGNVEPLSKTYDDPVSRPVEVVEDLAGHGADPTRVQLGLPHVGQHIRGENTLGIEVEGTYSHDSASGLYVIQQDNGIKAAIVPDTVQVVAPVEDLPICKPASDSETIRQGLEEGWIVPMLRNVGADKAGTDEHYSPEKYWRPWLEVTEATFYHLDPASHADSPIPTLEFFDRERDGLEQDWAVLGYDSLGAVDAPRPITLWANFPYSKNRDFTLKFCSEFDRGAIAHALILEKTDNGVQWYQWLLERCTSFLLINERVKHVDADGNEQNGGFFSSTLFYYGDRPDLFHDAYVHLGAVCQVTPSELYGRL